MNAVDTMDDTKSRPTIKKYTLPRLRSWLHISQVIFTILSVSLIAPVIALQLRFNGSSAAGPNYALFVAIFTFVIPIFLVLFPWVYESKNKMKRCGKFFLKPRTNLIFTAFYSLLWLTAGIAITAYALNPDTCNLDSNVKTDGYESGWTAQCNCAKVAMVLTWITCLLWIITLVMALVVFWKQKQMVQHNLQQMANTKQETENWNNEPAVEEDGQVIGNYDHYPSDSTTPAASTYPGGHNNTSHGNAADLSEPYLPPSYATQPYQSSSVPTLQYQQPSSIPQQDHYNDGTLSQQHQPLLPLAVMPDPQHYRQQHSFV